MNAKRIVLYFMLLALLSSTVLFNNSCRHDPVGIANFDTVCFETQIKPILESSCGMSGCHGSGGEGVFSPSSYQSIMSIVQPGSAAKSELYQVITSVNAGSLMPPKQPLTKEQRTLIMIWIEQGATNNPCSQTNDNGGGNGGPLYNMDTICFNQNIAPIIQSSCGKPTCHDAITHKEGYVLTNYNTLVQKSGSIVPFNPNSSKIYKVITSSNSEDIMPPAPNQPLTTDQKEQFRKWIAQGALNSDCPWTSCDTTGTISFLNVVKPILQNNCTGCHNSSTSNGNVDLSSYTQVKYYSETLLNGTPIIIGALRHRSGFIGMPPSGILNICQIRTVELWISQGMLDN